MARGAGVLPIKKKSAGKKESDQNSDITVFSEENFAGNSETFELSNTQFKTNFDISFKEPVKSIIVSGGLISTYLHVPTSNLIMSILSGNPWILYPEPSYAGRPTFLEEGKLVSPIFLDSLQTRCV